VDQLLDNMSALELTLTDDHGATLEEISAPELAFPASANRSAPAIQFGGTTVDGREHPLFPILRTSPNRY
jgi:hypothetical protein